MGFLKKNSKNVKHDSAEDWFYLDRGEATPISVTKETLQNGLSQSIRNTRNTRTRKQVNFQSYKCRKYRNERSGEALSKNKSNDAFEWITTYMRDYFDSPVSIKCETEDTVIQVDPIFNRKTKNPFIMLPSAETKFMDDALFDVNRERKKIDFFRQLRNISFFDLLHEPLGNNPDRYL